MDAEQAAWVTHHDGEAVELPHTVGGIVDALSPERRAVFMREVAVTPAWELEKLLGRWTLETRPDIRSADDPVLSRLKAGGFSRCVPLPDGDGV